MIDGLHKLREELHNKILICRSIEATILQFRFERLWNYSNEEQKEEVREHIKNGDKNKVIEWMRNHPCLDIGEKSLKDLYPIARDLHITNYSRLQRDELIIAIKKAESDAQ